MTTDHNAATIQTSLPAPAEWPVAVRLMALVSAHTRRANRYRLLNAGLAAALAGVVAYGMATTVGSTPAFRYILFGVLWAGALGAIGWDLRRRWWTDTAMGYFIDCAQGCDNLVRSAW